MKKKQDGAFTQDDYFNYFKKICEKYQDKKILVIEIESILIQMKKLLTTVTYDNTFEIMGKLFGLDSRLQIIMTFINDESIDEQDLIRIQNQDYKSFMKEGYTSPANTDCPSIHYLIN